MPSILPNHEYDIFISYRQNDNKRDKWVTQFVEALKDELEATLKNPVSIYFDENSHYFFMVLQSLFTQPENLPINLVLQTELDQPVGNVFF